MKLAKITAKNLKLLLRSKTSMFVIIFGPLIIMLLVGFAFNNPSASKLNIGYYAIGKTNLTSSFVAALSENPSFLVSEFSDEHTCISMIEQGKSHICIVFPENFQLSNQNTNEVIFYVDQSRANFVYAIIDTVSQKIDFASNKLSYQMTSDLLSALSFSQKANNENIAKIITLKTSLDQLSTSITSVKGKLNNIDLSSEEIDTTEMTEKLATVKTNINTLKKEGTDLIADGNQMVEDIEDFIDDDNASNILDSFVSTLEVAQSDINKTYNTTIKNADALEKLFETLELDVEELNIKLAAAKDATTGSAEDLTGVQESITKVKTDIDAIKASIEKINAQINALKVTSAESIVNPITTRVEPISTKSSNLNFIFPYLVILIIVFISIMLSSTIIIIEKTSKAYFRNFTTPTSDLTFIASVFLTSFLVIILQLIFVLILAYYFLNTTILTNIGFTLLTVFASIVLFTLLGMFIGYLFNSQEAVTMASISVGSVLLFLSNLVLPLETMSVAVQEIARYNPYVVASELLKKVTLFSSEWPQIQLDFVLMIGFIVVLFILTLIVQKMSKIQYISKKPIAKQIVHGKKEEIIDKYFKLKNGVLLRDEKELLLELKKMSDVTFSEYVGKNKNDFEGWLLINNDKALAKAIGKCKTRQEMIDAIEEYNKKIN
ncbi:MAG: ABC transporter permease [Candidatus Woesearchaeota archaeon]